MSMPKNTKGAARFPFFDFSLGYSFAFDYLRALLVDTVCLESESLGDAGMRHPSCLRTDRS
jgi:hypothetical protein